MDDRVEEAVALGLAATLARRGDATGRASRGFFSLSSDSRPVVFSGPYFHERDGRIFLAENGGGTNIR